MSFRPLGADTLFGSFADDVICTLRGVSAKSQLAPLISDISRELGFRHYALVHHDDLRDPTSGRVDLKDYPEAIVERLIGQSRYRRDPIIRGCLFSGSAFLWSEISQIIHLDGNDRESFALGMREGLNEGITVPYARLGDCMGSCTFAGTLQPQHAGRYLGVAQMVGIFAFQAALRLFGSSPVVVSRTPRLHPRPRDCIVLAGRGCSNKEIARLLSLSPRTVDGYLTEARQLFDAHDRTELVVSAVLAGEVSLHELRRGQPEHLLGL